MIDEEVIIYKEGPIEIRRSGLGTYYFKLYENGVFKRKASVACEKTQIVSHHQFYIDVLVKSIQPGNRFPVR